MPTSPIAALIAGRREGWTLPQPFFNDPEVYRADLDRVWRTGWLFAGHSCEISGVGDYFLVEVDVDSVIVIRGDGGAIHALHNVCRHRGSLICDAPCGHVAKLVCPYHQWAYGLDGRLLAWRGMQSELRKEDFPLQQVQVREVEGLIFINLATKLVPFDAAFKCLAPLLKPQGLGRAKVAKLADYWVKANWKIVWENNRECFHCNVNHPQYIKANFDHYNANDTSERIQQEMDSLVAKSEARWAACGLAVTHKQTGMTLFPDAENNIWYSINRTILVDGFVSESLDGKQIAPLMGNYTDPDVGTLRMRTMPNFWNHSSCDHAVTTRLLPLGPHRTQARVLWLVDKDAQEGRDYTLETLLPFWQFTSEQDWEICANQQRGVASSAYRPGPYSTYKEYNVDRFVQWYLKQMRLK